LNQTEKCGASRRYRRLYQGQKHQQAYRADNDHVDSLTGLPAAVEINLPAQARFSSVFLALRRHRVPKGSRLLGQPLDLWRSSRRAALLTDVADGFEVGKQFVEKGQQFRQQG
jgi:hypothetical protein